MNAKPGCVAVCTFKRELENYLHSDAVSACYQQNGMTVTFQPFGNFDDVPEIVATKLHELCGVVTWDDLEKEKQKEKVRKAKAQLNRQAVALMTIEQLDQVDPNNDVRTWLKMIKDMCAD